MRYAIHEVDAPGSAEAIHFFNGLATDLFPPLQDHHLANGYWWIAFHGTEHIVGFAGLVPMSPFPNIGYMKRCFILPDHRGHGLQRKMLEVREAKARELGWTMLVAETRDTNLSSRRSFETAGYSYCDPEQKWGAANSVYFVKST